MAANVGYDLICPDEWKSEGYRYRLDAITRIESPRRLVVVQLNPSQAGKDGRGKLKSDSTVGKVVNWAQEDGFSRVTFLNLFAYVCTQQAWLNGHSFSRLVGPRNNAFISKAVYGATRLVLAWGQPAQCVDEEFYCRRIRELRALLGNRPIATVGPLVAGRFPRHGKMWNRPYRDLRARSWQEICPE